MTAQLSPFARIVGVGWPDAAPEPLTWVVQSVANDRHMSLPINGPGVCNFPTLPGGAGLGWIATILASGPTTIADMLGVFTGAVSGATLDTSVLDVFCDDGAPFEGTVLHPAITATGSVALSPGLDTGNPLLDAPAVIGLFARNLTLPSITSPWIAGETVTLVLAP